MEMNRRNAFVRVRGPLLVAFTSAILVSLAAAPPATASPYECNECDPVGGCHWVQPGESGKETCVKPFGLPCRLSGDVCTRPHEDAPDDGGGGAGGGDSCSIDSGFCPATCFSCTPAT